MSVFGFHLLVWIAWFLFIRCGKGADYRRQDAHQCSTYNRNEYGAKQVEKCLEGRCEIVVFHDFAKSLLS